METTEKIIEYIEGTNGVIYYFEEEEEKEGKNKEELENIAIENFYNVCNIIKKMDEKPITFFTNRKEVELNGFNIHRLIAPEAIEINCIDNCIREIIAPKAIKIDCRFNPIDKIEAPNCKEIDIKITTIGSREFLQKKEDFHLSKDCKIIGTDKDFYKDNYYAFLKNRQGIKIAFPVRFDGVLEIKEEFIPTQQTYRSVLQTYTLETDAKYINIKDCFLVEEIHAPNAINIDFRGTSVNKIDLPKAQIVWADNTPLQDLNAPESLSVTCDNSFISKLDLPKAENIRCKNCKNLKEIHAPNCTKIDFSESMLEEGYVYLKHTHKGNNK